MCVWVWVCVCVCARVCVCACVCVRVCACVRDVPSSCVNVCVYMCVSVRERDSLCICVCVDETGWVVWGKETRLCVPACVFEVYAFWMACIPSKGETGTDVSI